MHGCVVILEVVLHLSGGSANRVGEATRGFAGGRVRGSHDEPDLARGVGGDSGPAVVDHREQVSSILGNLVLGFLFGWVSGCGVLNGF